MFQDMSACGGCRQGSRNFLEIPETSSASMGLLANLVKPIDFQEIPWIPEKFHEIPLDFQGGAVGAGHFV